MRNILILGLLTIIACNYSNEIDVSNIDNVIASGMSKKELVEKIGMPLDSIKSEKYSVFDYEYETNDFTGYTLKIWFDSNNQIDKYRID